MPALSSLPFCLREEHQAEAIALVKAHADWRLRLRAPWLLRYETANAVLVASRRGRITDEIADRVLRDVLKLHIARYSADSQLALALARQYGRSAYDASYLALAQEQELPFVTADRRLHDAVVGNLSWVVWIGDWRQRLPLAGTPS